MQQNPFSRHPPAPDSSYGDGKKMGICGAPPCRCSPLLLALCIILTGLVLVGVGSCIVGFMGNDTAPKALGASLIAIGLVMMIVGAICFVYDTFYRTRYPIGQTIGYAYQPQESTQFDQPSTSYGAAAPSSSFSDAPRTPKGHENVAPPAYDAVLEQKAEHRSHPRGARPKNPLIV